MRGPENLKLKYFLEKMTLCDVWNLFSYVFHWRFRSKDSVVFKFPRCKHRDDTSVVDGDQRKYEVLIVFFVERPNKEGASLGGRIELRGCSGCVWGLRSLLNTEGILTLSMFPLGNGSLVQMWSDWVGFCCLCLLLLNFYILLLGVLWRYGGFRWHWWFYI